MIIFARIAESTSQEQELQRFVITVGRGFDGRMNDMQEDITYCANTKCENISCDRNPKNIRQPIPHSFAALEGTEYCKKGERACRN